MLSHVLLFATTWTVSCQAPLFMGFSKQEYWSGVPFLSLPDLPDPGIELPISCVSCIAGGLFIDKEKDDFSKLFKHNKIYYMWAFFLGKI